MLQKISSVFVVYRRKTLTGSPDPTHANGTDKPCIYVMEFIVVSISLSLLLQIPSIIGYCWFMSTVYDIWPGVLYSIFGVFVQFILFILPLIILVYCYGRIVWVLHSRIRINTNKSHSNQGDKFQLARKNTIKTFLLFGLCFIICWSQNQVYYLMYNLGFDADLDGIYYKYTILMTFLNCTVNPFIYLIKYEDYQKALKNFMCCRKVPSGPILHHIVSSSSTGDWSS